MMQRDTMSKRTFLIGAMATPVAGLAAEGSRPNAAPALKSMTGSVKPISIDERRARIAKAQSLLQQQKLGALIIEPGSSLEYFTGVRWHRSERTTAAIIPAHGDVTVVTPAFEEPSVRETLVLGGDVKAWNEHESPFERIVQSLKDHGIASGSIAVESTTRFFIIDGIRKVSGSYELVSGDPVVRPCRLIKSAAELALMQIANDVTIEALRQVHGRVERGMSTSDLSQMMDSVTVALGASPEFSLVLLNEASAYPHGSRQPQSVHEGSVILMDCGCSVESYQSDISRSWVFGEANAKQRKVWDTVKRGQEIALENARLNVPVGSIDDAVRHYYEQQGWGPGYHLPGLSHRTGHGIGLDGHESPYLVHGDGTALQPGMCFSDEPGIYIPGEFGIRLEDCWTMTASGPKTFTALAASLEKPI
jgi:Xaa-Pro dipeptidase